MCNTYAYIHISNKDFYKNIYLYMEREKPDTFTTYKLLNFVSKNKKKLRKRRKSVKFTSRS